jgi:hypothetical protein
MESLFDDSIISNQYFYDENLFMQESKFKSNVQSNMNVLKTTTFLYDLSVRSFNGSNMNNDVITKGLKKSIFANRIGFFCD